MPPMLRSTGHHPPVHERSASPVSSTSSTDAPQRSYLERLSRAQVNFASLPQELRAASCSPPPTHNARVTVWRDKVEALINDAGGDPSHPKWGHLSRLLKLRCTSRGYVGAARGVRVGEISTAIVQDIDWDIPDTEDEWWECERKWEERHQAIISVQKGKQSKYWKTASVAPPRSGSIQEQQSMKAVTVREKVTSWQAQVASEEPLPEHTGEQFGGEHEGLFQPQVHKMQSLPVPFPTAKYTRESNKSVPETSTIKQSMNSVHPVPEDMQIPSVLAVAEQSQVQDTVTLPSDIKSAPKITDISEMSFLPPSFPSQLKTSTPPQGQSPQKQRMKPPPIMPVPERYSSPFQIDLQSEPGPSDGYHADERLSSASPLANIPLRRAGKRARSPTPPIVLNTNPQPPTPPAKKPRDDAPRPSSMPSSPIQALSRSDNAKAPHVLATPEKQVLPTLTELLASSRRSKPRARPLPRRNPSSQQRDMKNKDTHTHPPVVPAEAVTSPTNAAMSSPASGLTDSPASAHHGAQLPISPPLFSQHPDAFAPAFFSTQHSHLGAHGGGFLGMGYGSQHNHAAPPLVRTASGIFSGGYSSQFDVEGQIGDVADLLERDVDYDGWLRDLPDEDVVRPFSQSQSQSQDKVK